MSDKKDNICRTCRSTLGVKADHLGHMKNGCDRDKVDGVVHYVPHPLSECPYYVKAEKNPGRSNGKGN
jgi:hypothetical protein